MEIDLRKEKARKELERKLNNFDFSCGANTSDLDLSDELSDAHFRYLRHNYCSASSTLPLYEGRRRTCTHLYGQMKDQAEMSERPSSWKYCYSMQECWESSRGDGLA